MNLQSYWLVVPLVGIGLTLPLWAWLLLSRPRLAVAPANHLEAVTEGEPIEPQTISAIGTATGTGGAEAAGVTLTDFDLRLKLAQIDRELAHHDLLRADLDRKRQEITLAPWQLVVTCLGAGAALLVAGAALAKLFL